MLVNVQMLRTTKVSDAQVALVEQVLCRAVAPGAVVDDDCVHVVLSQDAVGKKQGDIPLAHLFEVIELSGCARQRHENAVCLGVH